MKNLSYESKSESDLKLHLKEKHAENFKCEYCDFAGNKEGELNTHIRRKHNNKINQHDWKLCDFCNFNCKYEREFETHIHDFNFTHSRRNNNQNIQQVDREISEMSRRGFIMKTFQTEENQAKYLNRNSQENYYMGKSPR